MLIMPRIIGMIGILSVPGIVGMIVFPCIRRILSVSGIPRVILNPVMSGIFVMS